MDESGIASKLFLPVALIAAVTMMPTPEASTINVELKDWPAIPAPIVTVESPGITFPEFPIAKPSTVTVQPAEPVVVEERVDVPGPVRTVYEEVEVEVEKLVEVRTCLNFDELPSWDLARAISMARPGESWSLSGDYYPGLNWLHDSPKPSEGEIIAGWLKALEAECE